MSTKAKLIAVICCVIAAAAILVAVNMSGSGGEYVTAGFNAEFLTRPDGHPGLKEAYNFEFAEPPKQMDTGLMYKACANKAVDVICAFATDGRIEAYNLYTLDDNKNFFPPYYAAPLMRADLVAEYPQVQEILNKLGGKISDSEMREMNYKADRDKDPLDPEEVATEFLVSEGLIDPNAQPGTGAAGTVTVGGKDFTEQQILGEMMSLLIEYNSDLKVTRKLYLGGTMICFNALKSGNLDVYAEYTGTGLVNILQDDIIPDPDKAYNYAKEKFENKWNLIWGEPFGFNNTYTLTMRKAQAEQLGIETVSDLAEHIRQHKQD
ncbi:MAG: glycine betaine ABC transporter substrate-binding protein [Pirellulaceae bacterium]